MPDSGEALEAFVKFKADDKQLTSVIEASVGKINQLKPAASSAEGALNKVWNTKSGASGLNSALENSVRELDKITPAAKKAESSAKQFFHTLKQEGGRRSALGESLELFRGGGGIIAVTMLGDALAKATEKANELDRAFQHGQTDAAGIAVAIGEAIPVIGGFVKAGQEIRSIFQRHGVLGMGDGSGKSDQDHIDETNQDTALQEKLTDMKRKTYRETRDASYATGTRGQDFDNNLALANTTNERDRAKVKVDIEFKDNTRTLSENLEKEIEKRKDALAETIKAIQETYKDRPDQAKQRDEKIHRAGADSANDIKQLTDASEAAQKSLDRLHDKAVKDVTGIEIELRKLKNATDLIGKSELDKYTTGLKQSGLTDQGLIGDLEVQKAKEIGAILKESLLTPMEKYTKENESLKQLLDKGGIDNQTLQKAQYRNAHEVLSSVHSNSVEGAFIDNIKNRFIANGMNDQVDELHKGGMGGKIGWEIGALGNPDRNDKDKDKDDGKPLAAFHPKGESFAYPMPGKDRHIDKSEPDDSTWDQPNIANYKDTTPAITPESIKAYRQRQPDAPNAFEMWKQQQPPSQMALPNPNTPKEGDDATKENTKETSDNTDQLKQVSMNLTTLNSTLKAGVVGVLG